MNCLHCLTRNSCHWVACCLSCSPSSPNTLCTGPNPLFGLFIPSITAFKLYFFQKQVLWNLKDWNQGVLKLSQHSFFFPHLYWNLKSRWQTSFCNTCFFQLILQGWNFWGLCSSHWTKKMTFCQIKRVLTPQGRYSRCISTVSNIFQKNMKNHILHCQHSRLGHGSFEAIGAQGINTRQHLALINPSDKFHGLQLPRRRHSMLPQTPASEATNYSGGA